MAGKALLPYLFYGNGDLVILFVKRTDIEHVNDIVDVPHSAVLFLAHKRTRKSHSQAFETLQTNTDTLIYSFFRDWKDLFENTLSVPFRSAEALSQ